MMVFGPERRTGGGEHSGRVPVLSMPLAASFVGAEPPIPDLAPPTG